MTETTTQNYVVPKLMYESYKEHVERKIATLETTIRELVEQNRNLREEIITPLYINGVEYVIKTTVTK